MANVTITQLPAAGAITGQELVPIVQNGQTDSTNDYRGYRSFPGTISDFSNPRTGAHPC